LRDNIDPKQAGRPPLLLSGRRGGKSELHRAGCPAKVGASSRRRRGGDGKCHRKQTADGPSPGGAQARVKRWGKSPPLRQ